MLGSGMLVSMVGFVVGTVTGSVVGTVVGAVVAGIVVGIVVSGVGSCACHPQAAREKVKTRDSATLKSFFIISLQ